MRVYECEQVCEWFCVYGVSRCEYVCKYMSEQVSLCMEVSKSVNVSVNECEQVST